RPTSCTGGPANPSGSCWRSPSGTRRTDTRRGSHAGWPGPCAGWPGPDMVAVRLFASLRELAGASRLEIEAADVGELLGGLAARFGPEFERIMSAGAVIVDGEPAPRTRRLSPGEEVALLPPVSGG